jgi:hypothetical protein
VILVFSCVYFVGMLGITLVNLIPAIAPSKTAQPPAGIDTTRSIFWVSAAAHAASHTGRGWYGIDSDSLQSVNQAGRQAGMLGMADLVCVCVCVCLHCALCVLVCVCARLCACRPSCT